MRTYQIGPVGFCPEACELHKEGVVEHVQPQVRNVLMCLLEHADDVVSKETLLQEAWKGRPATEECLTRCISILRKQLDDHAEKHLIETIPRVGYRLHCTAISGADQGAVGNPPGTVRGDLLVRVGVTIFALLGVAAIFLLMTV